VLGGIWFTSLAYMPQTYLYASERAWLVARVRLLELVPYIVAAAWLTSSYGALGAAIVWSARSAIDAVILFALATRTGGLPFSPLSTRSIRSLVAPCALAAAVLVISRVTGDLAARVGVSAGLMAIYSVLTWFVVLTAAERDALASLMARLRRSQRTA
jgi:peptidoglycan biosynthesis protein MviN/MurJ (putative lipid II flippase)